jgi:UDP-3-O-[3-hydroxymyristoyl] glucosamine N-acyltransferase
MKLAKAQTIESIAKLIGGEFIGPADFPVLGINEIHKVESGDLVFVDHPKYYQKALNSAATVVLINQKVECPIGKALIYSEDPCRDFNILNRHFFPWEMTKSITSDDLVIGTNSQVHPSVIVGKRVVIGERCIIHPGVVLYDNVHIGNDCIIHANTVIGSDAFYYKTRPSGREKMYTCGWVEIEDEVEIGASCTIDRGLTADTRIGSGTKIDNQVHIGHDTVIGKNCLFAAQVGLAGCVRIEDNAILWGQVGVASDVLIGKGAVILGQCGVTKDLEGGKTYFGSPAEDVKLKYRELALIRKLPEIVEHLKK